MTQDLFRQDAYLRECSAQITAITDTGIVLDQTVFYPLGGGQAGDSGVLVLGDGSEIAIADTRKGKDAEGRPTSDIVHVPAAGQEERLVAAAHPLTVASISDEELDANPSLVKSMSVQPPRGTGRIRTIRIGGTAHNDLPVDLQPCGGTHVANTAEIGAIVVTKIEKKSATTRRVVLGFAQ
ncbi:MAG: alanyl-tRNA editing protein [Acidovorax sp.]|nr:MAG: alanyl-tRNA editing protein [Acidovorax sp.]